MVRSMDVANAARLQADLEASQRQAALYGTLAVHASFGDVELAQMSLRGAVVFALTSAQV